MYIDRHFTRATLYGNLEVKCRAPEWAQNADTHLVLACAIEMQVNRKLTRKMPAPSWSTLIKHRPLPRPKEPLSVETLFGQNQSFPEVRGWSHMLISLENQPKTLLPKSFPLWMLINLGYFIDINSYKLNKRLRVKVSTCKNFCG